MPIINVFPGGSGLDIDVSETTMTPENARAGYSFFDASEKLVVGGMLDYEGVTTVTPSTSDQILPTAGTYVADDLTVEAIPSGLFRVQIGTAQVASNYDGVVDSFPITFTFEEDLEFESIEDVGICIWWCGNDEVSGTRDNYVITYAWSNLDYGDFFYSSIVNRSSAPCTYSWGFGDGTSVAVSGNTLYLNRPSSASGRFLLGGDYMCVIYYPR